MKKAIVYTVLFFYMASSLKPFMPAIFNYVSKTIWEISYRNHVRNMNPRVNLLVELADMAKHNSPKPVNIPQQDACNSSSGGACVVPEFKNTLCFNQFVEKLFPHYLSSVSLVFRQITVPPPKAA